MTNSDTKKDKLDKKIISIVDMDEEIKKEIYKLSKAMTSGIKKWEKVIYPMMLAFILLAAYGFYLIYNVTNDMSKISKSVETMSSTVVQMNESIVKMVTIMGIQMSKIDKRLGGVHESMQGMEGEMSSMGEGISSMDTSLKQMNNTVNGIYQSVYYMGQTTGQMNSNFSELNENISRPLDSMNNIMPWSMFGSQKYSNHQNRMQPPPVPIYSPYNNSVMPKENIK